MHEERYIIKESDKDQRIDKFLSVKNDGYTRSFIQKLLKQEQILVNEKEVKANYRLKERDVVRLFLSDPASLDVTPENIPLSILYEDDDLIVIDKPKNMVVHPAPGHESGTVVNALLYHCKDNLSGINGILRPGIVHRIDKNTTGAIVICKNDMAHQSLAKQLKEHSITRKYQAIVYHHFAEPDGRVEAPIGRNPSDRKKMAVNYKNGKEAVTHYHLIRNLNQNLAYIECRLETGRTHQIRVHMASIGHPLLGDDIYGPAKSKFQLEGQTLHAGLLGFIHPSTHQYMEFISPLPEYFQKLLRIL